MISFILLKKNKYTMALVLFRMLTDGAQDIESQKRGHVLEVVIGYNEGPVSVTGSGMCTVSLLFNNLCNLVGGLVLAKQRGADEEEV